MSVRRLGKTDPLSALGGQFAIGLSLFEKRRFQRRGQFVLRQPLKLKRVLQIFGNHLHDLPAFYAFRVWNFEAAAQWSKDAQEIKS